MPSLKNILSIASSALQSQQRAIEVTAHNIANASTEGFSRQRVVMSEGPSLRTTGGIFGSGVRVMNINRIRDTLLDQAVRRETSFSSEQGVRSDILARVEGILGEPQDSGLAAAMDAFFSAWSELATTPASRTARTLVLAEGQRVASTLNRIATSLDNLRAESEARLLGATLRINELTTAIANVNTQIVAAEAGQFTAGDLRDQRARLVDQLATFVPVTVTQRTTGSIGVQINGITIVDGAVQQDLVVRTVAGTMGLGRTSATTIIPGLSGESAGILNTLNVDIPSVRADLDSLASELVAQINAIHRTGTNPAAATNVDFFDAASLTATSIRVAVTDASEVAAGLGSGTGEYQSGANSIALSLAGLRDTPIVALGSTFNGHLSTLVSSLGQSLRSSKDAATVHSTLADQADTRRLSDSSVSTDEELIRLLQFQTAYASAARVVTTVDEMMRTLLAM